MPPEGALVEELEVPVVVDLLNRLKLLGAADGDATEFDEVVGD